MERYTQKQLKNLVSTGAAIDVTHARSQGDIPESYSQIGYAAGTYGCNGMLLKGNDTGKLYAVTHRTQAIYLF
jgi:hypothetical protein